MRLKVSKGTVIRTATLILAIVNNALALFGKSPLPIESETLTQVISFLFTTGAAFVSWWENNSFTQEALAADEYLKTLKESVKDNE